MKSKIIGAVVFFLIGLGAVWGGIALATEAEVSCEIGGPAVQPGQTCTNGRPGRVDIVSDYDEQREGNQRAGWVFVGFGVLFLVGGVYSLIASRPKHSRPQ